MNLYLHIIMIFMLLKIKTGYYNATKICKDNNKKIFIII